jgi:hypothetical protein
MKTAITILSKVILFVLKMLHLLVKRICYRIAKRRLQVSNKVHITISKVHSDSALDECSVFGFTPVENDPYSRRNIGFVESG